MLVGGGVLEDFEAVEAEQVARVFMPGAEVVVHIGVEGRPVIAHLKHTHTHTHTFSFSSYFPHKFPARDTEFSLTLIQ